jgi:hypothetical protein
MTLDIASRVQATIEQQGSTVTYKRQTSASFNSTTMANTVTTTSYTISAHFRRFTLKEISGLVREGDREVRISANAITFTPQNNDIIEVDGDIFKVVSVDTRVSYGTAALHILVVRGGY